MLIAMAEKALKPRSLKMGGNMAGVTMPREVERDPNPIPKKRVCSILSFAIPLTYSIKVLKAEVSLIRKIRNIVQMTASVIPKALIKPMAVAPRTTSKGVLK
jgi:hypothetical protein